MPTKQAKFIFVMIARFLAVEKILICEINRKFFTVLCCLSFFIFTQNLLAQDKKDGVDYADFCHVYVVNTTNAEKIKERYEDSKNPEGNEELIKLVKENEVDFPEFKTKIGEEELTTDYFNFPGSNLIITASVFYTDESMDSITHRGIGNDSMIIGIAVSKKRVKSAIGFPPLNGAITEIAYNEFTSKVRAKQYVKFQGIIYLVGLECDCSRKRQDSSQEKK